MCDQYFCKERSVPGLLTVLPEISKVSNPKDADFEALSLDPAKGKRLTTASKQPHVKSV